MSNVKKLRNLNKMSMMTTVRVGWRQSGGGLRGIHILGAPHFFWAGAPLGVSPALARAKVTTFRVSDRVFPTVEVKGMCYDSVGLCYKHTLRYLFRPVPNAVFFVIFDSITEHVVVWRIAANCGQQRDMWIFRNATTSDVKFDIGLVLGLDTDVIQTIQISHVAFVANGLHGLCILLDTAEFTVESNHTDVTCVTRRSVSLDI